MVLLAAMGLGACGPRSAAAPPRDPPRALPPGYVPGTPLDWVAAVGLLPALESYAPVDMTPDFEPFRADHDTYVLYEEVDNDKGCRACRRLTFTREGDDLVLAAEGDEPLFRADGKRRASVLAEPLRLGREAIADGPVEYDATGRVVGGSSSSTPVLGTLSEASADVLAYRRRVVALSADCATTHMEERCLDGGRRSCDLCRLHVVEVPDGGKLSGRSGTMTPVDCRVPCPVLDDPALLAPLRAFLETARAEENNPAGPVFHRTKEACAAGYDRPSH